MNFNSVRDRKKRDAVLSQAGEDFARLGDTAIAAKYNVSVQAVAAERRRLGLANPDRGGGKPKYRDEYRQILESSVSNAGVARTLGVAACTVAVWREKLRMERLATFEAD